MTTHDATKELKEDILRLKTERNAIIIAHNYQRDEVQDIADFTGDSLELSRKAAESDADVIVFCGVDFMAESASILSPQKTVLLPELGASCQCHLGYAWQQLQVAQVYLTPTTGCGLQHLD